MIFNEFDYYMGPRSGNAMVAAAITNHCASLAYNRGSSLVSEYELVKEVYGMCYRGCAGESGGGSEEEEW
jgi:hypothetical protein